MQDLLPYASVIYDANCIVYFCFVFKEENTRGVAVEVRGPDTQRTRDMTERLVVDKKTIVTIRKALDEAGRVLSGKAIEDHIRDGYIQERLLITGRVPGTLKLRIAQSLKKEFALFQKQAWFLLDAKFAPAQDRVDALKQLYTAFCLDPEYQKLIPGGKGDPSEVDIWLILFSRESKLPLVTNDGEIFNLAAELKTRGFCELIKPFKRVELRR